MPELHTCYFDDDSVEWKIKAYYDILPGFPATDDTPEEQSDINICTIFRRLPSIYPVEWTRWHGIPEWFKDHLNDQCYRHSLTDPDKYDEYDEEQQEDKDDDTEKGHMFDFLTNI